MSFEILLKFVKVFWYTSYFFIFWQVVRVSNMKKQQNFFKPVPSHIVTDNFFYLEACGNHLASIYQLHILLQPMRVWNHCCHVSEYNVQSYSLEIISKQHFKHLKLSCCCLPLMLLGFPFLTLHIFHNKLFLMKNLDISILCILQHSVFLTLHSLFLSFLWEVHLPKFWPKSALLTPFTGASFVQLKGFWLLLFIYGLHLLRTFWKKSIRKAREKKFVGWGRQFSFSSGTDESAKA